MEGNELGMMWLALLRVRVRVRVGILLKLSHRPYFGPTLNPNPTLNPAPR